MRAFFFPGSQFAIKHLPHRQNKRTSKTHTHWAIRGLLPGTFWMRASLSGFRNIISYRSLSCHIIYHVISYVIYHVISYIISCHIMSCHIMSYHIMSHQIISHVMSYIIYHITHHVISCHISCHVSYHIIYHVILCLKWNFYLCVFLLTGSLWHSHLWCNVVRGSAEGARVHAFVHVLLAHAEVGDLDVSLRVQHHVVQLQVSANE